jgi:hypothetical protein
VKEKLSLGSPFFGAFSSDRIPKATKKVNAHFFIHGYYARESLPIIQANSGNFLKLLCSLLLKDPAVAVPSNKQSLK